MKIRNMFIPFALGLCLTLGLLWLLGGSLDVAQAQSGTGVIRVTTTGADAPGCGTVRPTLARRFNMRWIKPCRARRFAWRPALVSRTLPLTGA